MTPILSDDAVIYRLSGSARGAAIFRGFVGIAAKFLISWWARYETRTYDPLIEEKSQLLYQLSYAPLVVSL